MLDVILKGGKIVDGTGNPWFYGDIGICGDSIVQVGNICEAAVETIDVTGKFVSPGFIDAHTHSDLAALEDIKGEIKLRQGVTTVVFGNCGFSPAPVSPATIDALKNYAAPVMGKRAADWNWHTFGDYMQELAKVHRAYNIATFVGNGALRIAIKGFAKEALCKAELEQVKSMLIDGMEHGALGLSLGMLYVPEAYYSKADLLDICSVLRKYNGLLTVHIRGEGNSLIPSIKEVIEIAEQSGIALNISHFKAAGKNNWNKTLSEAMDLVNKARERGIDVTADVYPYTAGSTTLASVLPPWAVEGGLGKAIQRLEDPQTRRKIREELQQEQTEWDNLVYSTGWDSVVVSSLRKASNKVFVGKSVAAIAELRGQEATECAFDLFLEEEGNVTIVFFHMSEDDVEKVIQWENSSVISDSLYSQDGIPHPRLYGTFPRLFAKYVRAEKALSVEQAVRKITSFPASRLNLAKRGILAEGYVADITVFDLEIIQDKGTYIAPAQYPEGIELVLVGGQKVVEKGKYLGAVHGKILKRN